MRKVIVNTTPLIALADIGQLDLLRNLYTEVMIPNAVDYEIISEPARTLVSNAAKKTAKFLGFTVTGTMGVLLRAKREGLITEVKPLLERLIEDGLLLTGVRQAREEPKLFFMKNPMREEGGIE